MRNALQITLFALSVLTGAYGHASPSEKLFTLYQAALQKEDAHSLSNLITADADIQIRLQQKDYEDLVLSLTREEFLQQLRALWRFANSQTYQYKNIRKIDSTHDTRMSFQQIETYQLFGEKLERTGEIELKMSTIDGITLITAIRTRTREW